MLSTWLTNKTVHIIESTNDWKSAIEDTARPLLEDNSIEPSYIEAIYQSHEKNGPYYVIAPGIAMPHARPEEGVNKLGLSLLLVKKGVQFNSSANDPVYIIIMLATPNSDAHLNMIMQLTELFSNQNDINEILKANKNQQILSVIKKY